MREADPLTPSPRALRFLQVVEHSPAPALIADRRGRVEHANAAFVRESGWAADALRARDWRTLLAGPEAPVTVAAMVDAVRTGRAWRGEVMLARPDGGTRRAMASLMTLGPDAGAAIYFAGLPEGSEDAARREEELEVAREQALAGVRARSEFLQHMNHELRTPMNGIIGMADVLLQSQLSPVQRADLLTLKRSADQLLTVISQLFDFARHESEEEAHGAVPFRLRGCLREVHDQLASEAEARGLGWEIEVEDSVPDALIGDAGGLRQALMHLAHNALKFTDRGRALMRVAGRSSDERHATLEFEITDSGIGIADDRQSDIFEAFERADRSNTRNYGGVGLGLTLAMRIVRRMGGKLSVESAPERGSTFRFTLTFERAAMNAADAPAGGEGLAAPRVLLLDAGSAARRGAAEVLRRSGVEVVVVPGHDAALSVLGHDLETGRPFDAVILDQRGGGLDAFEVTARLREAVGDRLPPVLLYTTVGQRGDAARCEDLGIAAYLTHPVSDSDVRDALRLVLATSAADGRRVLVTRHLLRETRGRHRVLLVEDNAVNRRVATRLLERSGFEVGVAVHGLEAVAMFPGGGWDIVLMDLQMPEMDGLDATRAIRQWESAHGMPRTPIVAVTTHALDSDRAAVREAGMDDFVAKPIQSEVLFEVMGRHLRDGAGTPDEGSAPPELREVLDWDEALDRMDGDEPVLREILSLFGQDAPSMMHKLEEARVSGEGHRIERAAHGLKGASATISARAVTPLAMRVEQLARDGRLAEALDLMEDLRREMLRLVRALDALPQTRREAA